MRKITVFLICGLLCFVFLFAEDVEEKSEMGFEELPEEVQKSFLEISKVELITEIDQEKEAENIMAYEIETQIDEVEISHVFTQDGALIEVKKSIAYSELPEITQKILKVKFPGLKIEELEEVQEFSYELEGILDGKMIEIEISNDGDLEIEEEPSEDEDEDRHETDDDDLDEE